ncbi:MAG: hypothetical protein A3J48_00150 [Candidatus Doudnabacteria bacterium RIFCSPHIGHO2_02_FULL_46_11]|uniref:acylphosphatase n=1 Tax=Candidatus Doudnabacteria bacterium RIFCSPHIGHO2_02_FULL_46_11 TaxID=1817832 RepID=A0A1F5P9J8_9BACT|nr:MAG: hypothetical protein A3J48_00150 [Candidatus Doudnabacteria bacterium RIFCSPHIGHO2_02_FULL_46_11]
MKHIQIVITGAVQGVSFRYFAKQQADELGLTGFTENRPDGSVYIEIEGGEENLQKFLDWCRSGPNHAQVKDVIVEEGRPKGYAIFEIKN